MFLDFVSEHCSQAIDEGSYCDCSSCVNEDARIKVCFCYPFIHKCVAQNLVPFLKSLFEAIEGFLKFEDSVGYLVPFG